MLDEPDKRFVLSRQGILFLLSAPSGAGKTTLSDQLLQQVQNLHPSISYTTRPPRAGEVDGREYHFVTDAEFRRLQQLNAFAEWARVHDFFYGTARAQLESPLFTKPKDVARTHQPSLRARGRVGSGLFLVRIS